MEVTYTTIVRKYPSFRDDLIRGCWKWLEGRRADDNAEGLWRVHDKLYDLQEFIKRHPGGFQWIEFSKGTDITEAFESYHIYTSKVRKVLEKFYVRDAREQRNYCLTYDENGLFKTMQRRVAERLKTVDKTSLWKSKATSDLVLLSLCVATFFISFFNEIALKVLFIFFAGLLASCLNNISHNFIHQRNNWRMKTAHVVLWSWRDWRVFHGMSHHPYPNSFADFETSVFEPAINYLPIEKSKTRILFSYFVLPFVYVFAFHAAFIFRLFGWIFARTRFYLDEFLSLIIPLCLLLGRPEFTYYNFFVIYVQWTFILFVAGVIWSTFSLSIGHHGSKIIHQGDEFKSLDFGIYQLSATSDRDLIDSNVFLTLICFGSHISHHFFPSLDHALLPQIKDIVIDTIFEFQEEIRRVTIIEGLIEQLKQIKRTKVSKLNKNTI